MPRARRVFLGLAPRFVAAGREGPRGVGEGSSTFTSSTCLFRGFNTFAFAVRDQNVGSKAGLINIVICSSDWLCLREACQNLEHDVFLVSPVIRPM